MTELCSPEGDRYKTHFCQVFGKSKLDVTNVKGINFFLLLIKKKILICISVMINGDKNNVGAKRILHTHICIIIRSHITELGALAGNWKIHLNVWLRKVHTEVCFSLVTHWFRTCHSKMIIKWHSRSKFHGWMTCRGECQAWNLEWTRTLLCCRLSVLHQVTVQACVVRKNVMGRFWFLLYFRWKLFKSWCNLWIWSRGEMDMLKGLVLQ